MFSNNMNGFTKNEDCPSSHELLAFEHGDISLENGSDIRRHLALCEFCSAEVEFYSRYPQDDSAGEVGEIPAPLYELAEALLKHRNANVHSLNELLRETEELSAETVA